MSARADARSAAYRLRDIANAVLDDLDAGDVVQERPGLAEEALALVFALEAIPSEEWQATLATAGWTPYSHLKRRRAIGFDFADGMISPCRRWSVIGRAGRVTHAPSGLVVDDWGDHVDPARLASVSEIVGPVKRAEKGATHSDAVIQRLRAAWEESCR